MWCTSGRAFGWMAVVALVSALNVSAVPAADRLPGDVNCDQRVDTADLAALVEIVSGAPDPCGNADVNGDGEVTSADVTALILTLSIPPPTDTATMTATPTVTPTPSNTPTPTIAGPQITFFGLADSQGIPMPTAGADDQGNPVYDISLAGYQLGVHFNIVVEAKPGPVPPPGTGTVPPGTILINSNIDQPPDLQMQANRDLGNGSALVCDNSLAPTPGVTPGGVPGVNTSLDPVTIAHIENDLGCRFTYTNDSSQACTCVNDGAGLCGGAKFAGIGTTVQYCTANPGGIGMELQFQSGDTLLTAQVRGGTTVGNPRSIIVRVPTQPPTSTPMPTDPPTATPPPTFTFTPSRTPTLANTATLTPTGTRTNTPTDTPQPSPTPTASETPTPSATPTASDTATEVPTPSATPT